MYWCEKILWHAAEQVSSLKFVPPCIPFLSFSVCSKKKRSQKKSNPSIYMPLFLVNILTLPHIADCLCTSKNTWGTLQKTWFMWPISCRLHSILLPNSLHQVPNVQCWLALSHSLNHLKINHITCLRAGTVYLQSNTSNIKFYLNWILSQTQNPTYLKYETAYSFKVLSK